MVVIDGYARAEQPPADFAERRNDGRWKNFFCMQEDPDQPGFP